MADMMNTDIRSRKNGGYTGTLNTYSANLHTVFACTSI